MIAVGGACGVLETNHLNGRIKGVGLNLPFNMAVGAFGGVCAGWFFSYWGQLYFGWFGPLASGAVGAAFLLPITNWLISLASGKWALGGLMPGKLAPGKATSPADRPPS